MLLCWLLMLLIYGVHMFVCQHVRSIGGRSQCPHSSQATITNSCKQLPEAVAHIIGRITGTSCGLSVHMIEVCKSCIIQGHVLYILVSPLPYVNHVSYICNSPCAGPHRTLTSSSMCAARCALRSRTLAAWLPSGAAALLSMPPPHRWVKAKPVCHVTWARLLDTAGGCIAHMPGWIQVGHTRTFGAWFRGIMLGSAAGRKDKQPWPAACDGSTLLKHFHTCAKPGHKLTAFFPTPPAG